MNTHANHLLEAAADPARLKSAYAHFIGSVLASPLWSDEHPDGVRVPWRLVREAATHPELSDTFRSPGLYLFGSAVGVPLYLGMTRGPLKKRLFGRYVRGPRSQCQLAADFEHHLLARGLDGFPEDVRGSRVPLAGAVTFAQHGIDGIWLTVLPIAEPQVVRPLERPLIAVADAWNRGRGYPSLVNRQDLRSRPV